VEDTQFHEAQAFGWAAVQSALTQIQVREGFTLKRVKSAQEVVNYLYRMTEFLKSEFSVINLQLN
jgi:ERCC4-type nuclease